MGRAIEPPGASTTVAAARRTAIARTGHQEDRKIVQRATAAVFRALRDRSTANEADQVFAQLDAGLPSRRMAQLPKDVKEPGDEAQAEV
jgi:uncharacterized protein (DUF2267 family)